MMISTQDEMLLMIFRMMIFHTSLVWLWCFFDRKALIFQLYCAFFTIKKILSFDCYVKSSLDIIMVLTFSWDFRSCFSALGSISTLIVTIWTRCILFWVDCFSWTWTNWGTAEIIDERLILFVIFCTVITHNIASFWCRLKVISHQKIVKLAERLIEFYLHLTNIILGL